MNLGAIDIGSNAIRLIISHVEKDGTLTVVEKVRAPIRLGAEAFSRGQISRATINKMIEKFKEFKAQLDKHAVEHCWVVATSAMREARNGAQICQDVLKKTGIQIEIICGRREAKLIFSAIQQKIDLTKKTAVLIDVGGGSVEISVVDDDQMIDGKTFAMGTVRLNEQLKAKKFNENHFNILLGEHVDHVHNYLNSNLHGKTVDFCIGTGGNLECLAKLKSNLLGKSPNHTVSTVELEMIIQKLRNTSLHDRIEVLGLRKDRADVIVPALLTVQMVMRQSGAESIRIPFVGLRDGILWDLLKRDDKVTSASPSPAS